MAEKIVEIINYVLQDVVSGGLEPPRVEEVDWYDAPQMLSAMIYSTRDYTGRGLSVSGRLSPADQLVSVADQIQEWVFEENQATASNWPPCPMHPDNHPMSPRVVNGSGVWACPLSNTPIAAIGELAAMQN